MHSTGTHTHTHTHTHTQCCCCVGFVLPIHPIFLMHLFPLSLSLTPVAVVAVLSFPVTSCHFRVTSRLWLVLIASHFAVRYRKLFVAFLFLFLSILPLHIFVARTIRTCKKKKNNKTKQNKLVRSRQRARENTISKPECAAEPVHPTCCFLLTTTRVYERNDDRLTPNSHRTFITPRRQHNTTHLRRVNPTACKGITILLEINR